jgi:hypothetical protein
MITPFMASIAAYLLKKYFRLFFFSQCVDAFVPHVAEG